MLSPKRISLLLAATFVASLLVVIVTTLSRGQTKPSTNPSITVLRRKGQRNLPPTAAEIASFRSQLPKEERTFEDKIPKHVPIKIKLKSEKEKAFKDLTNSEWERDFELEVTNTSDKPIYYMELWLVLPETYSENNVQLAFPLRYGRVDFIHFNTRPIATDVPIQPGETYTFTIPETWQRGWRQYKLRSNVPEPRKTKIDLVHMSFGDGTGFRGTGGEPYPFKRDESSTGSCREGPNQIGDKAFRKSARIPFPALREHSLLPTPAAILPVSFFLIQTSYRQPEAPTLPDINCPGTDCIFSKEDTYQCACNSAAAAFQIVGSGDPEGHCQLTQRADVVCEGLGVSCTQWVLTPCATPTPSPSPSPSPSCDPNSPKKLNNTNCQCLPDGLGGFDWFCGCADGSAPADYNGPFSGTTGCDPTKTVNNGSDCCVCVEQNHTCNPGCQWSTTFCECVDNLGSPCSAATPTPAPRPGGGGGGGGGVGSSCTEYYWVYYEYYYGSWHEEARTYAGCW
jgi:hypothetical protein